MRPERIRHLIYFGLAVVAFHAAAVAAVLQSEFLLPLRQSIAAHILSNNLDRPVDIRGDVSVKFDNGLLVRISDAYIAQDNNDPETATRAFEEVSFRAPYDLLVGNTSGITNFTMTGAVVSLPAGRKNGNQARWSFFKTPTTILTNPFFKNLQLANVKVEYVDPSNGWNEQILIKTWEFFTAETGELTTITLDAEINSQPVTLTADIDRKISNGTSGIVGLDMRLALPGLDGSLIGKLDTSSEIAVLDGTVTYVAGSVAELLRSLEISGELEATANLTGKLTGPLNELRLSDLDLQGQTEAGDTVSLTGTIGNVIKNSGIELLLALDLVPLTDETPANAFAIEVLGLTASIKGDQEALSVHDARIRTDLAVLDLGSIGPISIGRVVKHPDNRVGLMDVIVRHGPENAPYIELMGRIDNLVELSGIHLNGPYHFPTAKLMEVTSEGAAELGILKGDVVLSDEEGSFGLEVLTGAATGTNLFELTYDLAIPGFRRLDDLTFATRLSVPDFTPLLAALDLKTDVTPQPLAYDGVLGLSGSGVTLNGNLTSGSSTITTSWTLREEKTPGDLHLSGAVTSSRLDLAQFAGLIDLLQTMKGPELDGDLDHVELTKQVVNAFSANIDLNIKEIVTAGKRAGNVSGKLDFRDRKLTLSPLSMAYLGGSVNGSLGLDFSKKPVIARVDGKIQKLQLATLMKELGLTAPFSSTVYLTAKLTGIATSAMGFAKSMTGSFRGSLWGGTLPGRVIDLTGLNLVSWLFSGSGANAKLVCAVLPLSFKNGVASTKSLIVETENVQIVGGGTINLKKSAFDLTFVPRAKRKQLVETVSPFELKGPFGDPKLTVRNAGAGRAVGEIVALPLNLLGQIFGGGAPADEKIKPCTLPKAKAN